MVVFAGDMNGHVGSSNVGYDGTQDGCERVNVSFGTGLPGLSRTNGH